MSHSSVSTNEFTVALHQPREGRSARRYRFVMNNPEMTGEEFLAGFQDPPLRYVVFQLEKGEEEGTPHFQGYLELTKPCKLPAVMDALGSRAIHFNYCDATPQANIEYCTKEATRVLGPWTFGTPGPTGPGAGKRTELINLYEACKDTQDPRQVMELYPAAYMRHHAAVKQVCYHLTEERNEAPLVRLFYGPSGTGKTREALTTYGEENVYIKDPHQNWFDGYSKQPVLLLDEFAGKASKTPLTLLLRMLDMNKLNLPVKGAQAKMVSTTIIITTNIHPSLWYDYTGRTSQYAALQRRIHEVRFFPKEGTSYLLTHYSFFDSWYEMCDEDEVFKAGTIDDVMPVAVKDSRRVGSAQDLPILLDGPGPKAIKTEPLSDELFPTPPAFQEYDSDLLDGVDEVSTEDFSDSDAMQPYDDDASPDSISAKQREWNRARWRERIPRGSFPEAEEIECAYCGDPRPHTHEPPKKKRRLNPIDLTKASSQIPRVDDSDDSDEDFVLSP